MHEDRIARGTLHQLIIHRVGAEQLVAPRCFRLLTHRHPGIRHHAVGTGHRRDGIVGQLDAGALLPRPVDHRLIGVELRWTGQGQLEVELGSRLNPGAGDVVAVAGPGHA
jgi:hypothetical protein